MTWLRAVAPKTYAAEFEEYHQSFWSWWWALTKLRVKIATKKVKSDVLADQLMDCLLVFGRGLAKSASMEGALIAAGAMLGPVFCVYISSTQDKAVEHLQSIRSTIEGSELANFYPGLSNPRVGTFGNQRGWKAEGVYTDSGFTVVAASLEKGIRGLRDEERRPLILVFDDIDERNDSPKIKKEKLETLRSDAMGMLAPFGSVLFGQNFIYNGSIMESTWEGDEDWFHNAHRVGVINTFQDDLDIQKRNGRPTIVAGTPNWGRVNRIVAQDMLNKMGEDAFWRECQNRTAPDRGDLVWKHFDKKIHVITWEDFARVFGTYQIPARFNLVAGYDRGYTGWDKHPSVVSVAGVADESSPLPGDVFLFYEYVTDETEGVQEIARNLILDLATLCENSVFEEAASLVRAAELPSIPEVQAKKLRQQAGMRLPFHVFNGSHEGKHERDTFARDWSLAVSAGNSDKTAGLTQLHTYLQPEKGRRHPFYGDQLLCPNFYFVVPRAQKDRALDRFGLKRHRWEAENLKWDPNQSTRDVPTKFGDDATDAVKQYMQTFALTAMSLSRDELLDRQAQQFTLSEEELAQRTPQQVARHIDALHRKRVQLEEEFDRGTTSEYDQFIKNNHF